VSAPRPCGSFERLVELAGNLWSLPDRTPEIEARVFNAKGRTDFRLEEKELGALLERHAKRRGRQAGTWLDRLTAMSEEPPCPLDTNGGVEPEAAALRASMAARDRLAAIVASERRRRRRRGRAGRAAEREAPSARSGCQ
jgi:hypothetical protein